MPMRLRSVQDPSLRAFGAVYMPLRPVQEADKLSLWDVGHLPALSDA